MRSSVPISASAPHGSGISTATNSAASSPTKWASAKPSKRLEGFAEAHFVGEDAAELVAVEMPEPCGAEALIGTELRIERRRSRRGREGGKIFQRSAAR